MLSPQCFTTPWTSIDQKVTLRTNPEKHVRKTHNCYDDLDSIRHPAESAIGIEVADLRHQEAKWYPSDGKDEKPPLDPPQASPYLWNLILHLRRF